MSYITRTATYTKQYPDVCWININTERMKRLNADEDYHFVCTPNNLNKTWAVTAEALRSFLKNCDLMESAHWSFYINPENGVLYANINKDGISLQLTKCLDRESLDIPKKALVKTSTRTKQFPDVCWVNINLNRLNGKNDDIVKFYFGCTLPGLDVVWEIQTDELYRFVRQCRITQVKKYSFYIEPKAGILHTKANKEGKQLELSLLSDE